MTITERVELRKRGIEVLRPVYSQQKDMWIIAKCTINGGWARYKSDWFTSREEAQREIVSLASKFPSLYKSDE